MNSINLELQTKVISDRLNGMGLVELSNKYNLSIKTVSKYCKGIEGKKKPITAELRQEIKNFYKNTTLNNREIAERFRISPTSVSNICRGLPKKGRQPKVNPVKLGENLSRLYHKKAVFEKLKSEILPGKRLAIISSSKRSRGRQYEVISTTENLLTCRNEKGRTESFNWNSIFCGAVKLKMVS